MPVPTEFALKDWPSENRIEVLFTNDAEDPLCLLPEHWPNQAGKINQASENVFLLVGGRRFPIEDFNTGYCSDGCALVVHPGETVSSSIAYDDFQLPGDLRYAPKQLEMPFVAYACPYEP
jgi:hypothetical protein